ncbi:unnamed protein product [Staurois parvus]|uniref:Uncharacterized protein n=2 Tax=Staurois parvus TaxID=386267 RepID=A0ABN9ALM7_9NEOB|nr:unnamed protein product [Staurois parvus]
MVGVTSQVQQVAGRVVQRVRQRDGQERAGVRAGEVSRGQIRQGQRQDRNRNRMQEQDTGPRKNTHQGRVCRSGHPLNTPV